MNLNKIGSYNRIDILRRKLLLKKVWFVTNAFIFLPFITWLFFVWLGPMVDLNKDHPALSAWLQFWGVVITCAQIIFCVYIFLKINYLRDKVESIEWSISNK
jgi:hypothetical protein